MSKIKAIINSKPFFITAVVIAALIVPVTATILIYNNIKPVAVVDDTPTVAVDANKTIDSFVLYAVGDAALTNSTVFKAAENSTNNLYINTNDGSHYLSVDTVHFANIVSPQPYNEASITAITAFLDAYMKKESFSKVTDEIPLPNTLSTYTNGSATCALQGAVNITTLKFSCTTSEAQQAELDLEAAVITAWPDSEGAEYSYATISKASDESGHTVVIAQLADKTGKIQKYSLVFTQNGTEPWEYIADASDKSKALNPSAGGKYIISAETQELASDPIYGPLFTKLRTGK
ncbi:MAG: hypothetical protein V4611_03670 [Patescibacteria group bacterium]